MYSAQKSVRKIVVLPKQGIKQLGSHGLKAPQGCSVTLSIFSCSPARSYDPLTELENYFDFKYVCHTTYGLRTHKRVDLDQKMR